MSEDTVQKLQTALKYLRIENSELKSEIMELKLELYRTLEALLQMQKKDQRSAQ